MRWVARAWLGPACWLCMGASPSRSSAASMVVGWLRMVLGGGVRNLAGAIRSALACSLSLVAGPYGCLLRSGRARGIIPARRAAAWRAPTFVGRVEELSILEAAQMRAAKLLVRFFNHPSTR
jgi:hypothetical protein